MAFSAVVEVVGGLWASTQAFYLRVFMPKSLMVLGKVFMACPGSNESTEGGSGEGQFMGSFIQDDGEVLILLWRVFSPEGHKTLPEILLQGRASPGISCGRGMALWDRPSSFLCLFVCLFIPCNASMSRNLANVHLSGWDGLASEGSVGPGLCGFLKGQDGALAGASGAAL